MAFTTPTVAEFTARYPEFTPRASAVFMDSVIQDELDDCADEVNQMLIPTEEKWQRAVMCLCAHELTLRRGGGTQGGRGGGAVTSRSAGNVTASYGEADVPSPFNATNYGVRYYRRYVLRYGCLRFPS